MLGPEWVDIFNRLAIPSMLMVLFAGSGYELSTIRFRDVNTGFFGKPLLILYATYAVLLKPLVQYLSLMRPGRFCITSLDLANNLCSTIQSSVGICL